MAKEGKDTSELGEVKSVKTWAAVLTVLTFVTSIGGKLLEADFLPEGSLLYVILAAIVAVAGAVMRYDYGRSAIKQKEATAKGVAAAAQAAANPK